MTSDARFWDRLAERYAAKPLPNPASTDRKLEVIRGLMGADDAIVDLGCGTGTIALRLAPGVGHVHGVDVSGEMVRIAEGKARDQQVANVTFYCGGVSEGLARFDQGSVDGVLAFNILHLLEDWREGLGRIFETLTPGGYFVSSTPCLGGGLIPYRAIIGVMRLFGKAPKVEMIRTADLIGSMGQAGFVEIETPEVGADKTTAFVSARKPR